MGRFRRYPPGTELGELLRGLLAAVLTPVAMVIAVLPVLALFVLGPFGLYAHYVDGQGESVGPLTLAGFWALTVGTVIVIVVAIEEVLSLHLWNREFEDWMGGSKITRSERRRFMRSIVETRQRDTELSSQRTRAERAVTKAWRELEERHLRNGEQLVLSGRMLYRSKRRHAAEVYDRIFEKAELSPGLGHQLAERLLVALPSITDYESREEWISEVAKALGDITDNGAAHVSAHFELESSLTSVFWWLYQRRVFVLPTDEYGLAAIHYAIDEGRAAAALSHVRAVLSDERVSDPTPD